MAGLLDGVVLNCATTGTTSPLALGATVAPYLGMAAAGAVPGNTYSYSIVDPTNGGSEYGTGVWNAGAANGTLTRNPIWSTNPNPVPNSPINCSGSQLVRISALMEDLIPSAQLGPEFVMLNGKLVASVASNNFTAAVKTKAGNDPSAGDPVFFVFRNATLATGDYVVIKVTSALAFTINSGHTLGTANGVPFRLWICVVYDAVHAAVALMAQNCVVGGSSPTQIAPLNEDVLYSSTGSPGADGFGNSAGVLYGNIAAVNFVNLPTRILGYMEWNTGLTNAGMWASGPTKIQLFGPGIKKPGDVVQTVFGSTGTTTSGSSASFADSGLSASISPQSACNAILIQANQQGLELSNANTSFYLAVFRGATNLQLFSPNSAYITGAALVVVAVSTVFLDAPGTTSSTTYKTRYAANGTNSVNLQLNGAISTMILQELMA